MKQKYYLTTTLPYVNAKPHIGYALEIVQADVLARYHRLLGEEVFFSFGTDEHGKKIYEKALANKETPKEYADRLVKTFVDLKTKLDISANNFIRTTDEKHIRAAQKIWGLCLENGLIEKRTYKAKYCVGCELEKTDSELVEGKCELHPNREIELIEEENYFFLFSKLEKKLLEFYANNPDFVIPKHRFTEIKNFVEGGLKDFSISRLKDKMPWGIAVPNDPEQVMYVWFDALTNYISALGWPDNKKKFEMFWGSQAEPRAIQVAGKDNLRQQSAMWQAMLLGAGLPTSKQILIHGFITADGQKMSKSLGNVVDPIEYVNRYGVDALRYYLLAKIHPFEDSDFTKTKFEAIYKANLQNGLGNLVARVGAMAEKAGDEYPLNERRMSGEVADFIGEYRFDKALEFVWEKIRLADQYISSRKVWQEKGKQKLASLRFLVGEIRQIAIDLSPFLPQTAEKIKTQYNKLRVNKAEALFPRLE